MNRGERSSVELAQDIVHEANALVRLEIDLAKQEVKELAVRNAVAISLLLFAALLLVLAVFVALPVFLILLWDQHLLGAAIWLGAYVVLGAILALVGRLTLRLEAPRRTLASLEETKQWALRQIRSNER